MKAAAIDCLDRILPILNVERIDGGLNHGWHFEKESADFRAIPSLLFLDEIHGRKNEN